MPYIKQERRETIGNAGLRELIHLAESGALNAGDLNYIFTTIAHAYLEEDMSYQKVNDLVGALEGCKLELYRRKAVPYEDLKIAENGDV